MRPNRRRRESMSPMIRRLAAVAFLLCAALAPAPVVFAAAQHGAPPAANARFDLPDWISDSSAASLDVGIDVLVPGEPPAPFSGEPSISASSGYYNLYWLISGSPPTFLSITGESGGTIPDYSKYDRNVQLTVNASVNGSDAYHDVTPIYDLVYWRVGDVVYSVESENMTGTDSLSLANSLVVLTPPAAEEPTAEPTSDSSGATDGNASGNAATGGDPASNSTGTDSSGNDSSGNASGGGNSSGNAAGSGNDSAGNASGGNDSSGNAAPSSSNAASIDAPLSIEPGGTAQITISGSSGATVSADAGIFTATGRDSIINVANTTLDWEAPSPDADQTVTFQLVAPDSGDVLASAETTIVVDNSRVLICPKSAKSDQEVTFVLRGSGLLTVSNDMGAFPTNGINADFASNGTAEALSGSLPATGEVKLDWKAPKRSTNGDATITVKNENGDSIGSCKISVAKMKAAATPTPKPSGSNAAGQKSDGTDLRVTGPGQTAAAPGVITLATTSGIDDGSGILPNGGGQPAQAPTAAPAKGAPAPTKTSTPSVQPTATLAPTLDNSGMVSQVIGPDGGQLSCPSGATITIPPGALTQLATITLRPVANAKLPVRSSVDLLPNTAFEITVAGMDGHAIDTLVKPAQFSIALPNNKWRSGATIYAVNGLDVQPLSNVKLSGDSVAVPIDQSNRYVAGVPVNVVESTSRSMAKFIMAGAALIFLASVAALMFKFWIGRQSTMTVGPRRLR